MPDDLFPNLQRRSALKAALRDLFHTLGGNEPIRILAREAIARGVIPEEELARCQMVGVSALCREALKQKTENGLPFAKPTTDDEDGNWTNLELFTYEQAEALIEREAAALVADYHEILRLHRWCFHKFGRAPEIPELTEVAVS